MVSENQNHYEAGIVCVEELAEGICIDIYLLTGITKLSKEISNEPGFIAEIDFDVPFAADDFRGCWHELITLVMDKKEFHMPKRLAAARLPYVQTYLGSALAHEGRIELGIEAPARALDSLLSIVMGGGQFFETWWNQNAASSEPSEEAKRR